MKMKWGRALLLGLALLLSAPLTTVQAAKTASYRLQADKASLHHGGEVSITIVGSDLSRVYAMEAKLLYDPAKLQLVKSEGIGLEAVLTKGPESGTLTVLGTQLREAEGLEGSSNMLKIVFKGLQPGVAKVKLLEVKTSTKELEVSRWQSGDEVNISFINGDEGETPTPTPTATPSSPPSGKIITTVKYNESKNAGVSSIDMETLNKAIAESTSSNGNKKVIVEIEVPALENAESYELKLPAEALRGASSKSVTYSVKTALGTITLSNDMLSNMEVSDKEVSLKIGKANKKWMTEKQREQIGARFALELTIQVGGAPIAWHNPKAPVTVSIPYSPTPQELRKPNKIAVWYVDGQGMAHSVPNGKFDPNTQLVTFTITHFSVYTVAYVDKTFLDMTGYEWAIEAVESMASREVILGTDEGSFSPDLTIKRADYVLLIMRALELLDTETGNAADGFADVRAAAYYADALRASRGLGIVQGVEGNRFHPDEAITREDAMVLIYRALSVKGRVLSATEDPLSVFKDAGEVSEYARASVSALIGTGYVGGYDECIHPKQWLTRAEAAVLISKVLLQNQ